MPCILQGFVEPGNISTTGLSTIRMHPCTNVPHSLYRGDHHAEHKALSCDALLLNGLSLHGHAASAEFIASPILLESSRISVDAGMSSHKSCSFTFRPIHLFRVTACEHGRYECLDGIIVVDSPANSCTW